MSLYKKLFLPACLLLCFATQVLGQPGNEILEYTTTIKVDKSKLLEEKTLLIQVNNKQSDWITDVSIPYSGEKLEILEAEVLDMQGRVLRTLKKKEIISRSQLSQDSFYEDSFVKEFSLKWNVYPYRVRYSYRTTSNQYMHVANWFPYVHTKVPTRKASLSVEMPLDFEAKLDFSAAFTHQAETRGNSRHLRWEISNLAPLSEETHGPPFWELAPKVTLVPKTFTYGTPGSFESWEAFGNWIYQMNQGIDQLPLAEQQAVDRQIAGLTDQKEIVKKLYQYLQDNTRYINVAIDVGGMKPYPASYVSTNKYGDCKALTIYMKALLRHAGIESYYTVVYAEDNPIKVKPALPSQQFNHVVLCVPLAGDTLWLENTANHLPYNYLGTFTQNRQALLVSNQSRLLKTPALTPSQVLEKSIYTFALDQEGAGTLEIDHHLRGKSFEHLRAFQLFRNEKDQQAAVEESLRAKNWELQQWSFGETSRDHPWIDLHMALKVHGQFRKLGQSLVITPTSPTLPAFEKPEGRKSPLRINYPLNEQDSLVYQLPFAASYQTKLPQNIRLESKWGCYQEAYQQNGNQISISKSLQLFAGEYALEEYPAFWAFVEAIKEAQKKSVLVLNPL